MLGSPGRPERRHGRHRHGERPPQAPLQHEGEQKAAADTASRPVGDPVDDVPAGVSADARPGLLHPERPGPTVGGALGREGHRRGVPDDGGDRRGGKDPVDFEAGGDTAPLEGLQLVRQPLGRSASRAAAPAPQTNGRTEPRAPRGATARAPPARAATGSCPWRSPDQESRRGPSTPRHGRAGTARSTGAGANPRPPEPIPPARPTTPRCAGTAPPRLPGRNRTPRSSWPPSRCPPPGRRRHR